MTRAAFLLLAAIGISVCVPAPAAAADIRVLCSNGLKAVLEDLVPVFEGQTANRVTVAYGLSSELTRRIEAGERFDVAVLTPALIDDLIRQGRVTAASRTTLARSPIGLATRRGAPGPDLQTVESVARTLGEATSIAYAKEGASADFFLALVQQLGLTESLKPRIVASASGAAVAASVARGDVAFGVMPVSEILPVSGIEVAGTFPGRLAGYVTMTSAVSTGAADSQAAAALIAFLMDPARLPVLRARGMERGR